MYRRNSSGYFGKTSQSSTDVVGNQFDRDGNFLLMFFQPGNGWAMNIQIDD